MRIAVHKILEVTIELLKKYGLSQNNAEIVANCLIEAELAGITSHGISMLPAHINKIQHGYNIHATLTIEKSTPAFSVCNANNMIGMLSAWKCMELAVNKSSIAGMHTVFCHNANTFSAAYCFIKQAVKLGVIAVVCCNSPAQMAPIGGRDKLLGTNPIAVGIPADEEDPFLFDMATSAVAKSKINQALTKHEKIPFGWATDINGNPTDDPKVAVAGLVLPMAGAKGYGLSMCIDIISGVLGQASCLDQVGRFYSDSNTSMNVGHVFSVLDPVQIYGSGFYKEMDIYLSKVRGSRGVTGKVMIPGDINESFRKESIKNGIPLSDSLIGEINQLLLRNGIELLHQNNFEG